MKDIYIITIYTTAEHVLTFEVVGSCPNFEEEIAEALENGLPIIETVDGEKLIINGLNYVAITFSKKVK